MTPGSSNDAFTIKLWTYDLDLNIILFFKKKNIHISFTSNQIEECLAWSFTWVSVYVSLHDTDYGIEFMLMKSARNVKVGVEGRIQSNLDKLDTGNRNNKWNSKGDKGQALHLCRNNPFKQNTEQLLRKHNVRVGSEITADDSWVWVNSATLVKKSSIISSTYWKNKNLQFLMKFHADAAAALRSVLIKTFQIRKSKRELKEWWEDRKITRHLFSSWCELKSGRLKKIKLFCLKRRLRRQLIKYGCQTERE